MDNTTPGKGFLVNVGVHRVTYAITRAVLRYSGATHDGVSRPTITALVRPRKHGRCSFNRYHGYVIQSGYILNAAKLLSSAREIVRVMIYVRRRVYGSAATTSL